MRPLASDDVTPGTAEGGSVPPPLEHPDRIAMRLLLERWLPGGEVGGRAYWRLRRHVITIGAALGVVDPVHRLPFDHSTLEHQVQVVAQAVDGFARRVGGVAESPHDQDFNLIATGDAAPLAGAVPARPVDRVDVNAAGVSVLAALPGLGPTSARRIVARRSRRGPYEDLEAVRRAARQSPAFFERPAAYLRVGDGITPPAVSAVERRLRADGVAGLLALWRDGLVDLPETVPAPDRTSTEAQADVLLELIAAFASEVRLAPLRPPLWAPGRERLRRAQVAQRRDEFAADQGTAGGVRVAPVFSAGYLPLLSNLLDAAREQVLASMFYLAVGEIEALGDPGDRVVDALAAAAQRGVDVRLILDDDLPGDRHGANAVNRNAFAVLAERGIPVRADHLEVASHAKVVVVDRRFVLVGSHNWTASSFFRYQETSCFFDSAELGERAAALIERRWRLLASPDERIVPVELLELLDARQRSGVVEAGLADGPAFLEATRTESRRRAVALRLGVEPDRVLRIRKVVLLMQSFRIAELTAVALVAAGLGAPGDVRRATPARLRGALSDLSHLEDPFGLCQVRPELADRLAAQEG